MTSSMEQLLSDPSLGARQRTVSEGQALYQPGTPPRNVYFVHRGQVRLYQVASDESLLLREILGPGQWCGAAALVGGSQDGQCGRTRAVAATASLVSEVPADKLLSHLARHGEVAVEFIRQLASRLRTAHEEAARFVFDDCSQRLIRTLVRFSESAAATPREDGVVVLRITHQQLAQAIGVARETVSLALTELRKSNVLRTGRNQLFFDPAALRRFNGGHVNGNGNGHARGEAVEQVA
jgi:CRP/FNR family transcriptional regulator